MSSETKWTPGPWAVLAYFTDTVVPASHVNRRNGAAVNEQSDRDDFAQIIVRVKKDRHGRGDEIANARLIAAAPSLYEALAKFVAHYPIGINPDLDAAYIAARAALASARGEG